MDLSVQEEAQDQAIARPRRAGGNKSLPPLTPESLADRLSGRPMPPARDRQCQTQLFEASLGANVCQSKAGLYFPFPEIARQYGQTRERELGQVAIPFRPHGSFIACEVQSVNDRAALPSSIGRWYRTHQWIGTVSRMAKPFARQRWRYRIDVKRHAPLSGAGFVECRNQPQDFEVTALGHEIDWFFIVESRNRLRQPNGNVFRLDHPRQTIHDLRQLIESFGSITAGFRPQGEPPSYGARSRSRRSGYQLIGQMTANPTAQGLFRERRRHSFPDPRRNSILITSRKQRRSTIVRPNLARPCAALGRWK